MKTKIASPKILQKESKIEFKKYSGIDAALINLGIKLTNEKASKKS
ncbi:MAG: hypothetical protein HYR91_11740 [Flavobacteriia bacterium]|nr:hypothetical protein [Flavobacteriia bacterium]